MLVEEDKNHVGEVWSQSEQDLEAQSVKKQENSFMLKTDRSIYLVRPVDFYRPTQIGR